MCWGCSDCCGGLRICGAVILAANHRSFMDSMLIPHVVKRRVTFVAKAEYFDSIKTRWFFKSTGQIPVRRDSLNSATGALEAAKGVLENGGVFAIYPEGTRTRDGFLHKGHTGVARLAIETDAVIIPVGIVGTENVQDVHEKLPRVGKKISIHFGNYDVKRLEEVCDNITDGDHGNPEYSKNGIPYLRVIDVKDGKIDKKGLLEIDSKYAKKLSKSCFADVGNILISIVGTLGNQS